MTPKPRVRVCALGRLYLLPRLPPMRPPFAVMFTGRPQAVALSINGGPRRFVKLARRPAPPQS